jgi:hypothetical protein
MKRLLRIARNVALAASMCSLLPWLYLFVESRRDYDAAHPYPIVNETSDGYVVGYTTIEKGQFAFVLKRVWAGSIVLVMVCAGVLVLLEKRSTSAAKGAPGE